MYALSLVFILQVFHFFCTGEECGIEDDNFIPMVKLNFNSPLTFQWFENVWSKEFPFLYTESDSPQCPECADYTESIRKAHRDKDPTKTAQIQQQKDIHCRQARDLFDLSESFRVRAKNYKHVYSYVVDNMASKNIPKYKKEKADAWSKDKLTLHLGGTYSDKDDSVHYYVYPELINESANTILSQIDAILHRDFQRAPLVGYVAFTFDNHNTQKNATLLAYFEWLAKSGAIPPEGLLFHFSVKSYS